jgi:PTH1 family peptidyl-tRNA hydrolase
MKKYIVGLGNTDKKYKNNRHNAGFLFIDYLLKSNNYNQKNLKNSQLFENERELIIIKPKTFMNDSGLAVREIVKNYSIDIEENLIIVHDDLDIPLGKYKYQLAKSPKDHNGIKSVESHLKTNKFYRIRIGIDNRQNHNINGIDYVLRDFNKQELEILEVTFKEIKANIINNC